MMREIFARPRTRTSTISFERLDPARCDWTAMDAFPDRVVFQTREWLTFLERTQGGEPVVAAVRVDGDAVGYFTGLIVRRAGVRILGSPFPGWTTAWMGFNLRDGVGRADVARALPRFAFAELGCLHVEVRDRPLADQPRPLSTRVEPMLTFELDLARSDDELFAAMTSACRRAIRRSEKVGVHVEEASEDGFAAEYHSQLIDVFAKQSLTPTYGVDRVRELIRALHPVGRILLLRALSPDGEPIATALFPAINRTAHFWGGASWRHGQIFRPNEAIFWYAMRYWRDRGMTTLEMGGGGDYKRKYGVREVRIPTLAESRMPGLMLLRDAAKHALTHRWLRRPKPPRAAPRA